MKLTDMIVSAIIKKGILFEARNVDTTIDIPVDAEMGSGKTAEILKGIKIHIKAEHMTIRIDKDSKEEA